MAQISLYSPASGLGRNFTAAGLVEDLVSTPRDPRVELGAQAIDGDSVTRRWDSPDRSQSRTVGYTALASAPEIRSASSWYDQSVFYDNSGAPIGLRRDQITGALQVDETFFSPTGTATAFARYLGLSNDGTQANLLPAFSAGDGAWSANELVTAAPSQLHSIITAGDDTLEGTLYADQISGGAGINNLYGRQGADSFYLIVGSKARLSTRKKGESGVLLSTSAAKGRKRYLYDRDVDIIRDYEPGIDRFLVPGSPSRYDFVAQGRDMLVFTSGSQNNLVAIIANHTGLKESSFSGY